MEQVSGGGQIALLNTRNCVFSTADAIEGLLQMLKENKNVHMSVHVTDETENLMVC